MRWNLEKAKGFRNYDRAKENAEPNLNVYSRQQRRI